MSRDQGHSLARHIVTRDLVWELHESHGEDEHPHNDKLKVFGGLRKDISQR